MSEGANMMEANVGAGLYRGSLLTGSANVASGYCRCGLIPERGYYRGAY